MKMDRLDIIIFGATGFTGKHAVVEIVRIAKEYPGLSWGVAGRSLSKLKSLMSEVAETTGKDQSHIKIIVADVFDEKSLKQMCQQARVIANCCGPYRLFGEPVVRAAIHSGTHYVDVTGEPQFIESMVLKYADAAREAGVFVVSACGYDSVPNDMAVVFLQENFGGTVNSIESYMSIEVPAQYAGQPRLHSGTWESLVHSVAHFKEILPLRKKMYPEKLPNFKPKLLKRPLIHRRSKSSPWSMPFMGPDASIVYRSQRTFYERDNKRPVQFKAYSVKGSFGSSLLAVFQLIFLYIMTRFSFLVSLLLKHPRTFSAGQVSHEGPTRSVADSLVFRVTQHAEGWAHGADTGLPPNKRMVVEVTGKNPAYGATVIFLIYCAITILQEKDKMPAGGGVLTTALAFKDTNLIKHLQDNGIKFEVIETATN